MAWHPLLHPIEAHTHLRRRSNVPLQKLRGRGVETNDICASFSSLRELGSHLVVIGGIDISDEKK